MILFAGIAAEALVYGEAEGGENDENLFRSFVYSTEPATFCCTGLFVFLCCYYILSDSG